VTTRPDSSEIITAIRAKIADGRLPVERPSQIWAGDGSGEPCDACDRPITPAEIEYEAQFLPARMLRFHRMCFDAWHQLRAGLMSPPISGGSDGEPRGPKLSAVIVAFLREHRGEAFCAGCLALKIKGTRDLASAAIFEIEGWGVRRRHGVCSACGNRRLVAGLPEVP
jgi:hypothetical protein